MTTVGVFRYSERAACDVRHVTVGVSDVRKKKRSLFSPGGKRVRVRAHRPPGSRG